MTKGRPSSPGGPNAAPKPNKPGHKPGEAQRRESAQRPDASMVIDPGRNSDRGEGARLAGSAWTVPFMAVLGVAAAIFVLTMWLDIFTSSGSPRPLSLGSLVDSFRQQDLEQARNTMGGLGEVMAAVLGLALTVSSIIVQLAATRFTPHVTSLFFRARANLLVLGFFVVSNIFVLWINFSLGDQFLPGWGVLISMALLTASLLLLFPYFAYVFYFLEPDSIVDRITNDGINAATPSRKRKSKGIEVDACQKRAVLAVEHLANIGLNAVQQKDKNIASASVNALCHYVTQYEDSKAAMVQRWFTIPEWNRESPDFVSLSDDAVADIETRRTWLEWKALRQYQMLFNEGLLQMKDLCYLIAINTRRLGESAARHGDLKALDLSIKFFNTYIRSTLNASDIRTAYNILHQYRQLGEFVLSHAHDHPNAIVGDATALQSRGPEIANYMRYYSGIAFSRGLAFLTEVIAHDVGAMCAVAFHCDCDEHDELLSTFLTVDETAESSEQEVTLRGVRRAQVKLATTYLVHGENKLALRIKGDMRQEPADRLHSIWRELERLDTREFWEVNDRGTNFDYLTPAQKAQLPVFFRWFDALAQRTSPPPSAPPPGAPPTSRPAPTPDDKGVPAT